MPPEQAEWINGNNHKPEQPADAWVTFERGCPVATVDGVLDAYALRSLADLLDRLNPVMSDAVIHDGMVIITAEFIVSGASPRGGWNRAQLATLGVSWPPIAGWKKRLIGKRISQDTANRFLQLRALPISQSEAAEPAANAPPASPTEPQ